ncbi:hypothetical protein EVAR_78572_1 [Eumeta japonica]|uniref:Uncharacterized protein n=1 Tax=Eumeta variegata TaxID=151549 RepID=A0A4C1W8N0_EUMVA|nr:hypothetical protein EVAR_78572_1 [Eumeta japonica]
MWYLALIPRRALSVRRRARAVSAVTPLTCASIVGLRSALKEYSRYSDQAHGHKDRVFETEAKGYTIARLIMRSIKKCSTNE